MKWCKKLCSPYFARQTRWHLGRNETYCGRCHKVENRLPSKKHVPKLTVERLSPVPLKTVSPCAPLELVELLLLPSTGLKESPTPISRRFPPAVSSMNIFWVSVVQRKYEPLGGSSSWDVPTYSSHVHLALTAHVYAHYMKVYDIKSVNNYEEMIKITTSTLWDPPMT